MSSARSEDNVIHWSEYCTLQVLFSEVTEICSRQTSSSAGLSEEYFSFNLDGCLVGL